LTLSRHYEIRVKEFKEKCVKKMILSERSEFTHFNIFTWNFSEFRTTLIFSLVRFFCIKTKEMNIKGYLKTER